MLQMEVLLGRVGVDAFKIALHPFEKGDFLPIFHKRAFAKVKILLFGFDQHQVHVGEHFVHIVLFGHFVGFPPKLPLVHVEVRDEVVLLHVPRCERAVEVVGNGDVSIFYNHFYINKL